jgi:hypothetical protein
MACRLVFLLVSKSALPQPGAQWQELVEAQSHSLGSGIYLRLFPAQEDWHGNLDDLIIEGKADVTGHNPFYQGVNPSNSKSNQLLCDSFIPYIEPKLLWLAVYKVEGRTIDPNATYPSQSLDIESVECLDQFPLREASNETCWFYPTEDGRYLSCPTLLLRMKAVVINEVKFICFGPLWLMIRASPVWGLPIKSVVSNGRYSR